MPKHWLRPEDLEEVSPTDAARIAHAQTWNTWSRGLPPHIAPGASVLLDPTTPSAAFKTLITRVLMCNDSNDSFT
ncbi:hypothetical protein FRC12_022918 [Ceratobasidium sp. 428]|nr:hypothetical protein FRC12_022918 [Ceratobasidium sp. 428]